MTNANPSTAQLPVIADVDVLVIGATTGGIAAATAAADQGASVFVISTLPYMGEDICGTYQSLFEPPDLSDPQAVSLSDPLLQSLFPPEQPPTPLRVKTVLENVLIDQDIPFLHCTYAVDVLQEPQGVVVANRTGLQAIRARTIIDCSPTAAIARRAGAAGIQRTADTFPVSFITVGDTTGTDPKLHRSQLPFAAPGPDRPYPVFRHTWDAATDDLSHSRLCAVEQEFRTLVWHCDQIDAADQLAFIPPWAVGEPPTNADSLEWPSTDACRVPECPQIYVLSGCAAVPYTEAHSATNPSVYIPWGRRVGAAAGQQAQAAHTTATPQRRPSPTGLQTIQHDARGAVQTFTDTLRPQAVLDTHAWSPETIATLDSFAVAIMGGGTVGANAAISAARHGAQTLVMEYLHYLGGTGTAGYIGRYWDGFRKGFTREIDEGTAAMAPLDHPRQKPDKYVEWDVVWKSEWYRQEITKASGTIWYGILGCGALVQDSTLKGLLIATSDGLALVESDVVIDATGSADVAIAAGADFDYTNGQTVAVQGAGLSPVELGDHYNNTDWTFIDDTDVWDITRLFAAGKAKYETAYDIGKLPQTRERRRVVGEHVVTVPDILNHRTYPDTISYHKSSFDTHGFTIHPFFTIKPPDERHTIYDADVPLRSLLPRGLHQILVTGLGASAHRDAMPVIRMQPCLQNQGYSVGYLAAAATHQEIPIRSMDIRTIQHHLVQKGILPERVLTDEDSFPLDDDAVTAAVASLPVDFAGLEVVLAAEDRVMPLLQRALRETEKPDTRKIYGQVLCMLGDSQVVDLVRQVVESYHEWDEGWEYTGMGQFGRSMSTLDSLIMALGETGQPAVLSTVLAKARQLKADDAFSHFRAVAWACERIGSAASVSVLQELLALPGLAGHGVTTLRQARDTALPDTQDVTQRNAVLKELHLARALFRCGDKDGHGRRILESYAQDLHGHYYRHASRVLGIQTAQQKRRTSWD